MIPCCIIFSATFSGSILYTPPRIRLFSCETVFSRISGHLDTSSSIRFSSMDRAGGVILSSPLLTHPVGSKASHCVFWSFKGMRSLFQRVVDQHAEYVKAIESVRYFISVGMPCILNFLSEGRRTESRGARRKDWKTRRRGEMERASGCFAV